jgi:hypothetical protein
MKEILIGKKVFFQNFIFDEDETLDFVSDDDPNSYTYKTLANYLQKDKLYYAIFHGSSRDINLDKVSNFQVIKKVIVFEFVYKDEKKIEEFTYLMENNFNFTLFEAKNKIIEIESLVNPFSFSFFSFKYWYRNEWDYLVQITNYCDVFLEYRGEEFCFVQFSNFSAIDD